jgi:PAS domain S-box-containing protein
MANTEQELAQPYSNPDHELKALRQRVEQLEQQLTLEQRGGLISRLSERRYRAIVEWIPQMVWATDSHGSHFYYNRRWYEYTGLSEEESLGFGFVNALHPDDRERTLERWQRAWRHGESYEVEYRFRRHDGTYHWFIGRALPITDAEGNIVEWTGTCTNIDEQKRAAEHLQERTEALARITATLQERNRELDQFAYIASHDLKAPLRGIAHLSQWIEEDLGDLVTPEVREHLTLLRGRVNRMENLINGLLQYSRIGRSIGTPEKVMVEELLDDVIDLLAPGPEVQIDRSGTFPLLRTERLPLSQVFSNLIGNAIKHHPGPTKHISISATNEGEWYQFAVQDDGIGIAPQFHERIFVIFQTLTPRDTLESNGLGLSLVKKIVEHQGGKVWVESSEGQGATFYFTWPAS